MELGILKTTVLALFHIGIFDDDAGNYGFEKSSVVHDEAGPSVQPPHEEAKPFVNEIVYCPQCDDTANLCDSFIGLIKDIDKPLYVGCQT